MGTPPVSPRGRRPAQGFRPPAKLAPSPLKASNSVPEDCLRAGRHHLSSDTGQMGLDRELVLEAEQAKEELAVAQHAAYRAKVDYHQAIRRLHAADGSLREIAEALRMSHQRVHQIIDEAAEPTRRRRRRDVQPLSGPVGPCSFCGRPRDVCTKLVAGPARRGTWPRAGWRCQRANSVTCPGSATGAGTCAWRSWPSRRRPKLRRVDGQHHPWVAIWSGSYWRRT